MKIILQRVEKASVSFDGTKNSIQRGLLLFVGITHTDTRSHAEFLARKCINLRIFEDENGKMAKSLLDIHAAVLVISQFTLYANTNKGNRPSFMQVAKTEKAEILYEYFIEELRKSSLLIKTGKFAAKMHVSLENDGPVTLVLEK